MTNESTTVRLDMQPIILLLHIEKLNLCLSLERLWRFQEFPQVNMNFDDHFVFSVCYDKSRGKSNSYTVTLTNKVFQEFLLDSSLRELNQR